MTRTRGIYSEEQGLNITLERIFKFSATADDNRFAMNAFCKGIIFKRFALFLSEWAAVQVVAVYGPPLLQIEGTICPVDSFS